MWVEICRNTWMDCSLTSSISSLNMSTRKSRHFSAKLGEDRAREHKASTAAFRTSAKTHVHVDGDFFERRVPWRDEDLIKARIRTVHLVFKSMHKSSTGTGVDQVYTRRVHFLSGSVVRPSPAWGEFSGSVELFGTLVSCALSLTREEQTWDYKQQSCKDTWNTFHFSWAPFGKRLLVGSMRKPLLLLFLMLWTQRWYYGSLMIKTSSTILKEQQTKLSCLHHEMKQGAKMT